MKRFFTLAFLGLIAVSAYGQQAQGSLVASVSAVDRKVVVKNSVDVPAWHERSFWPLYENYLAKSEEISSFSLRALTTLAATDKTVSGQEALEYARQMLQFRNKLQASRKEAYREVANALNGIIALQFLQTETLLDMMEASQVYEETNWKKFRFHPKALTPPQLKTAKQNIISKALLLTEEEANKFWEIYNAYEEECDVLLGSDYSMIALYAGDPADFTPALAKRLGNEFLQVLERESSLKEKYLEKMNDTVGPSLAARFLAWEDYFSLINKMYAWAEMQ